jgi:glucose/arabinose dehydrogenase
MLDSLAIVLTPVATLDAPLALVAVPGTDVLLAAERPGLVRTLTPRSDTTFLVGDPVLDLTHLVDVRGEGGLLGMAISPDGEQLYVSFTDHDLTSHVLAVPLDGIEADVDRLRTLLTLEQPYRNHNGGHLVVDPEGRLLIGFGDGGAREDPHDNSQDLGTRLGTILRIDPRGPDPYGIPAENPFIGDPDALDEILVWGLRNPWRFALDPATGDLWIADVGQDAIEEVTRIPAADIDLGINLGWPALEGDLLTGRPEPDEHRLPDLTYERTNKACSIIGGVVYRGGVIPGLAGAYVFGDFCDGRIRLAAIQSDGSVATRLTDLVVPLLASFAEDASGEVYALSLTGGVFRLDAG